MEVFPDLAKCGHNKSDFTSVVSVNARHHVTLYQIYIIYIYIFFLSFCFSASVRVTEEESTATTMEALKARIRELEKQILRGDRYKCLICMVSITLM